MIDNMNKWRESGKYLPKFMQDFHDQKDLFKAIHELQDCSSSGVSWVTGHIYVIDFFLWFMAKRGYTLQKSRKNLIFDDMEQDIATAKDRRVHALAEMIGIKKPAPSGRQGGLGCGDEDRCASD